jgi:hypothetical protein
MTTMVHAIRKSTDCPRYQRQERKQTLLLYYIGESTLNIFETLPETGTEDDYDKAYQALNEHFKPRKNTSFEIFKFRKTNKLVDETLDQYHVRLVQKAKCCEFSNLDTEIKAQIELGTKSKQLRRYAFRKPKLTLAELLDYMDGRLKLLKRMRAELSKNMNETPMKDIHAVRRNPAATTPKKVCFFCGLNWPHVNVCPAKGKTCNHCHKQNHCARCCKSRISAGQRESKFPQKFNERRSQVKQIDEQGTNSGSDEYVYTIKKTRDTNKVVLTSITTSPTGGTVNEVNSDCRKRNF